MVLKELLLQALPAACPVCQRPNKEGSFCRGCLLPPALSEKGRCWKCFERLPAGKVSPGPYCETCLGLKDQVSSYRHIWDYENNARDAIRAMKFQENRWLCQQLSQKLAEHFMLQHHSPRAFDYLVPIPGNPRSKRPFEITLHFAKAIERTSGIKVLCALKRKDRALPRSGLKIQDRLKKRRPLLQCIRIKHIQNKRLLLVDDVLTTGLTLQVAAQTLVQNGANSVSALVLARSHHWQTFRQLLASP